MATDHLATWACNLEYSDLPRSVIQAAVRSFYNWAGCAIGGSNHPASTIAHTSLAPFFGASTSTLLGHAGSGTGSRRTDAQHAALLNGIASHVHDYDDTHLDTIIHPTGPVASALLAVAEWRDSSIWGKDFLLALVVGIEAECKLGLAVWPEHYDVGWHITSTTGSIGATLAVCKLIGLPLVRTKHAVGIAATQVTGLRSQFGSHTKSFHIGRAAQNGLLAAVLAEGGYTSSEGSLEAGRGWANVVGVGKGEEGVRRGLEKWLGSGEGLGLARGENEGRWEILRNSFKPFPCGIVAHPVIDGCVQLHRELEAEGLDVRDIRSVHAQVHPLVLELTAKRKPKDGLEGKFSVFHGGAVGLLYGKATPRQYEDAVVQDPEVICVRDKIEAEADDALRADETMITLTMNNGRVFEKHIEHAVGSLEVPMDDKMLEEKFKDQCAPVLGGGVDAASQACWRIEDSKHVARDIAELL